MAQSKQEEDGQSNYQTDGSLIITDIFCPDWWLVISPLICIYSIHPSIRTSPAPRDHPDDAESALKAVQTLCANSADARKALVQCGGLETMLGLLEVRVLVSSS